ncbi:hypothetical protein AMTR_s00005p00249310 [Amborella trichopoda]|uniref:Uncharacterized protein n=1 Tax=Amborella trichopoda TaxID=13333 RepID=W1PG00_AMBTC|nr:hypothetical protein AMTR_s00005p00249310 [Amborella trichopoda]
MGLVIFMAFHFLNINSAGTFSLNFLSSLLCSERHSSTTNPSKTSHSFKENPASPLAEPTLQAHHELGALDKPLGLVLLDSLLPRFETILRLNLRRAFSLQKSLLSHSYEPKKSPSDTWVRGIQGAQARLQLMQTGKIDVGSRCYDDKKTGAAGCGLPNVARAALARSG